MRGMHNPLRVFKDAYWTFAPQNLNVVYSAMDFVKPGSGARLCNSVRPIIKGVGSAAVGTLATAAASETGPFAPLIGIGAGYLAGKAMDYTFDQQESWRREGVEDVLHLEEETLGHMRPAYYESGDESAPYPAVSRADDYRAIADEMGQKDSLGGKAGGAVIGTVVSKVLPALL